MDVCFFSSIVSEGFSALKGELDEKTGSILNRLDRRRYNEVAKEILASFTKAALLATRKKIFDFAVAREAKRRPLATRKNDATADETHDRAALFGQDPKNWRLVNRNAKPKIADDILLLTLYVKNPSDSFPEQVLKKASGKSCRRETAKPLEPTSEPNETEDWAEIESSEDERDGSENPEAETSVPDEPTTVKSVERFVIRENNPPDSRSSVEVTKLCNSGTSTCDLVHTRTIGTQTPTETVGSAEIQASNPRDSCETAKQVEPGESRAPSAAKKIQRTNSENSLLDYIEEKFETLRNSNKEMEKGRTKVATPAANEKRFNDLEKKYESVVRRVAQMERTHESDVKHLRDELISKIVNSDGHNRPGSTYDRTQFCSTQRRHSESDITSPTAEQFDPEEDPFGSPDPQDDSVWDAESCDIYVNTQDSQGGSVSTKATPVHLKEMNTNSKRPDERAPVAPGGGSRRETDSRPPMNTSTMSTRQSAARGVGIRPKDAMSNTKQPVSSGKGKQLITASRGKKPQPTEVDNNGRRHGNQDQNTVRSSRQQNECCCSNQQNQGSKPNRNTTTNQQQRKGETAEQQTTEDSRIQTSELSSDSDYDPKRRKIDIAGSCEPSTSSAGGHASPKYSEVTSGGKSSDIRRQGNGKKSTVKVVSPGGWLTVSSGQPVDKGNQRNFPAIKSAAPNRNKELYVRGMSCANFKLHKDLEEAVRWYCKDRNISTIHQRVIMYNKENDSVGIKVVVREHDVEKFMSKGFWPDGISVREWSDEKPTGRDRYFGNDRSSSEDSS